MTREPSIEDRVTRWLLETAPDELSDRVLDATFGQTRSLTQVSRGHPWRALSMRPLPILVATGAVAIVVIAFVAVGGLRLAPTPGDGAGTEPTPASPTAPVSMSPRATISMVTYSSRQYGYSVDIPGMWSVTPAIRPWPAGDRLEADPAAADRFRIDGSPIDAAVAVAAQPAPDGVTATTWLAEWERIREDIGGHCFGSATPWQETTVAGLPAWHIAWRCDSSMDEKSNWDEYTFLIGNTGYVISGTPSMVDLVAHSFRGQ